MDDATLGYIIGGSVGGGILIISVIACIICCTCGSKRKKKRHEKKFHHLTPDSGHQSQHSTLSHIDPRGLPKVGNGLWVEAPAVYQAAPNQGMYYGRPNPKYRVEPGVQRSASELRLQGHPPPGHAVYQGNVRIYHSQQLTPVYEVVDTSRAPGVISIYEYNDLTHSRSRLINRDSAERHHRDSKKVNRSHSDLSGRPRDKRDNSKRHSGHSHQSTSDKSRSDQHSRPSSAGHVKVSQQKSQSLDSLRAGAYDNPAFENKAPVRVPPSAVSQPPTTDSMKLQDKKGKGTRPLYNKTDDEKQKPKPVETEVITNHYTHEGSVYAVPNKLGIHRDEAYENPIVARMEEMIIEKTEGSGDSRRASAIRTESVASSASQVKSGHVERTSTRVDDVTASVPVNVSDSSIHITSGTRERKHPVTGERLDSVDGSLHPPLSATQSEDLGPTGNQVTAEAFQFLDNYIGSDDEGVESPPVSPGPRGDFSGY
ncbi:uncharacterized protein LOC124137241 isoform X1 [Haliotis rufescens]|uniref:uncharacterized protein LOC124137241 isoform X1 n=1 Tax=Haliotis rufescens TaxID=6454 RepID=UPI00201FAF5E|nr:uncharacterized protein LOC124137241 isoform X1 [Haliotis rufescens]XP_046359420.2 uncharacterized protein LOC124137241 isoform X1 [Haliotis rufescens]XP_046359421.2 uncharacterized protein LOC124137241 isoform X1 [Haliotis rufescens]